MHKYCWVLLGGVPLQEGSRTARGQQEDSKRAAKQQQDSKAAKEQESSRRERGQASKEADKKRAKRERGERIFVTPKGVLPLALCHASATHEGP